MRAERERRGDLAAAADTTGREHGCGRDRVDDLRDEDHRGDLARVPARLVALRHHDVDTVVDVALRVHRLARERRDLHAVLVRAIDDVLRRRPERVGDELDGVRERDVDVPLRDVVGPAEHTVPVFALRATAATRSAP